jgi:hypothetical protein
MIMEGRNEDMEVTITMQHDNKSMRKNDQFMEDIIEHDSKQVPY